MEKERFKDLKINKVAKVLLLDYMAGGFKINGFYSYTEIGQDIIFLVKSGKKSTELKIIKDYFINQIRVYKNKKLNNVIKL